MRRTAFLAPSCYANFVHARSRCSAQRFIDTPGAEGVQVPSRAELGLCGGDPLMGALRTRLGWRELWTTARHRAKPDEAPVLNFLPM